MIDHVGLAGPAVEVKFIGHWQCPGPSRYGTSESDKLAKLRLS
jgi:hypothetical protein